MGAMDDPTARQTTPSGSFEPGIPSSTNPETPPGFVPATDAPGATPPASPPPASPAPAAQPAPPAVAAPPPSSWDAPRRTRSHEGRWVSTFFGLLLLVIGLWYFAERTLGLDMPDISWNQFWPVILIAIGVLILYNAVRRERR